MIRCPKCGTMNRDNSRFCNECGTALQRTKVRCPACGTMNPVGNVFCDACNTRLVPETKLPPAQAADQEPEPPAMPLKGISLPARPTAVEATDTPEEAQLPDWLLELTEESTSAVPSQDESETLAEADLPDWMSDLTDAPGPEAAEPSEAEAESDLAAADLPEWMSGLEKSQAAAAPADAVGAVDVPDWLNGLVDEEDDFDESEESTAPEDLPDWLSDLAGAPGSSLESEKEPVQEPASATPSPDVEGESATLPDWLSALQDNVTESDEVTAGADWTEQVIEETPEDEVPSWLSGFAEETPEEEEAELPDWLAGVGQAPEEADVAPDDLPDWMSDAQAEPEPDVEAASPAFFEEEAVEVSEADVAPADLPSWMSEAEAEPDPDTQAISPAFFEEEAASMTEAADVQEAEFQPQAALPSWLLALADMETDYVSSEPQELPSWLLAKADQDATPYAAPPSELPAWLLQYAEEPVPAAPTRAMPTSARPEIVEPEEKEGEEEQASDWLYGLVDEEAEEEVAREAPAPTPAAVPDWLSSAEAPEEVAETEEEAPDWLSGLVDEEAEEEAPAVPDWLSSVEAPEEAAAEAAIEPEAPLDTSAEELPDWLADLQQEEATTADASLALEEELTEGEMPDWLSDIVSEPEAEAEPSDRPALAEAEVHDWLSGGEEVSISEPAEPGESLEELPAWLSETPEETQGELEEAPVSEDLPDWLKEGKTEAAPATPEPAGEIPDWLTGIADVAGEKSADASTVFTEGEPEQAQEPPAPSEDTAPDWLPDMVEPGGLQPAAPAFVPDAVESKDVTTEDMLAPDVSEGALDAEVPDWLSELRPGALEEAAPSAELPVDETLARAEVPSWLRGLKPPGTGPLPPLSDEAGIPDFEIPSEEESGLARAEIPDWVQALKATVTTEAERDRYQQPAEEEGPLIGLLGTLPPHAAVDIPSDYEVPPRPTLPDAIVQQATLWQQLLEQPRGKARPVAQAQKQQQTISIVTRLLVAGLLIAVAALGLFVPGQFWSNISPASRPGVTQLHGAIEALQPGDTVILAVEYGTGEAAEMDMIARTLMAHLAEREVNIIAVSTLPEGVGLAYELLEAQEMQNQLPVDSSPYIPGSYNGVAGFLATQQRDQSVSFLLILSSRIDRFTWWIEQNLTFRQPYPMGIAGTAALGPRMSPYLNTRGAEGWLIGFTDMVRYREQQGAPLRLVDHTFGLENVLNALMFTHWIALGLIVLGLLYTLATSRKRTK